MAGNTRVDGRHDVAPLVAGLVEIGVADAAEKNFDLDVVFGEVASCDRGGRKRRCRAGNGIGFCLVHEITSTSSTIGEQLARKSDYEKVSLKRYPDPANLLTNPVDAWILHGDSSETQGRECMGRLGGGHAIDPAWVDYRSVRRYVTPP